MKLISKEAAAAIGAKRYFTGNACIAGHVVERYVLSTACVECSAAARKKYRLENAESVRVKRMAYRKQRGHIEREKDRVARAKNPALSRARAARWREKNKEKVQANDRAKWPGRRDKAMETKRDRYANDPIYAMKTNARSRIGRAFKAMGFSKLSSASRLLGCSWIELKTHIERQFLKGMTWQNRGSEWHLDHIVPLALAKTEEEIKSLCHFTNLRPLWAIENLKKNAKRTHLI